MITATNHSNSNNDNDNNTKAQLRPGRLDVIVTHNVLEVDYSLYTEVCSDMLHHSIVCYTMVYR